MAAGSSSRLGTPKQLLKWKGTSLLEHVISTAVGTEIGVVTVVLGANKDAIYSKIERFVAEIIHNKTWKKGLGNSIAFGIRHISKSNKIDGALVVLGDQPLVTSAYLKEMISQFNPGQQQIIATQYPNGKKGVPVLFDSYYFPELGEQDGDKGAKTILEKYKEHVRLLEGTDILSDIDTISDYEALYNAHH